MIFTLVLALSCLVSTSNALQIQIPKEGPEADFSSIFSKPLVKYLLRVAVAQDQNNKPKLGPVRRSGSDNAEHGDKRGDPGMGGEVICRNMPYPTCYSVTDGGLVPINIGESMQDRPIKILRVY